MKERTGKALQFSSYPLRVAKAPGGPRLNMIKADKKPEKMPTAPPITDDPQYWDIGWFLNYE
jgi:hypothetical protein